MPILVQRLTATATLPTRTTPHVAGIDLYADEDKLIFSCSRALVSTGLAIDVGPGNVGLIWPRHGLALLGISVDAGLIDCDDRSEVKVLMTNDTISDYRVRKGERIAQLLVQPVFAQRVIEKDALDVTERGEAGFGSSGK